MNLKSLNEAVLTSSAALVSATVLRLVDALHVELESMKLELLTKVSSILSLSQRLKQALFNPSV